MIKRLWSRFLLAPFIWALLVMVAVALGLVDLGDGWARDEPAQADALLIQQQRDGEGSAWLECLPVGAVASGR